jgi:hypothetical protein
VSDVLLAASGGKRQGTGRACSARPRESGDPSLQPQIPGFAGMSGVAVFGSLSRTVARSDSLLYSRPWRSVRRMVISHPVSALRRATWRSGYATVCKTVYPGSIPGVASKSIDRSDQAPRRQTSFAAVDQVGPPIEGEAARELLVVPRCLFQQRCLQTSCCVVQLRLQAPVLVDAAGFVATAAVVGRQEFWQFIACVSQLT